MAKLKPVRHYPHQRYPKLKEFHSSRRGFLKQMFLSTVTLALGSQVLPGCPTAGASAVPYYSPTRIPCKGTMSVICSTGETLPIAISIITYGVYFEDHFCRMEERGLETGIEVVRQVMGEMTYDQILDSPQRPEVEEALRQALEEILPENSGETMGIETLTLLVLNWDIQNQE